MKPVDRRSESRKLLDKLTTEAEFQRVVMDFADRGGWTHHHETDSRKSKAGFPDLTIAHPDHGHGFIELKREGGYLRPPQKAWRDVLIASGARYYVFRPRDTDTVESLFIRGEWPAMQYFDH